MSNTATECFRCGSWNVLDGTAHCQECAEDQPREALALAPNMETAHDPNSIPAMRRNLMAEVYKALTEVEVMANECDVYPGCYRDPDFAAKRSLIVASLDAAITMRERTPN